MKKKVLINLFATTLVLASLPTISNFSNWEVTAFAQEHIIDNDSGITGFFIANSHNIKLGTPLTLTPATVNGSTYNDVSWKIKSDFGTNSKLVGNVLTPSSTGTIIITGTLTTNTGTYQKDFPVCVTNMSLSNAYNYSIGKKSTTLTVSDGYASSNTTSTFSVNCSEEIQYNVMAYLEGDDSDKFEIVKSPSTTLAKNVNGEFEVQLKEGLPAGVYSTYITLCSSAMLSCDPIKITVTVRNADGSSPTTTQVTTYEPTTQTTTTQVTTTEPTTQATTQYTTTEPTTQSTTTQNTTTQATTIEPTTQSTTQNNNSSSSSSSSSSSNTSSIVSSKYNKNIPTLASTTALNTSSSIVLGSHSYQLSRPLKVTSTQKTTLAHLIEATNGFIRFEYMDYVLYSGSDYTQTKHLLKEEYNSNYELVSETTLPIELTALVGFHEGIDHYYLMFSDSNLDELDSKEVLRVVKYDKNWNRINACSINDIRTITQYGPVDMMEVDGKLLIHTAHTRYKSYDGYSHQHNLKLVIDTDSMTLLSDSSSNKFLNNGDVSHSINQMIAIAQDGSLITANQGDATPRAFVLFDWGKTSSIVTTKYDIVNTQVFSIYGDLGNMSTNATLGGVEFGSDVILLAGSSVEQNANADNNNNYNIFYTTTPRDNFSTESSKFNWVTNYSGNIYATSPHLVYISEDKFVLLWNERDYTLATDERDILCYQVLDGSGNKIGGITKLEGKISSVEPVVDGNGNIVWYTTYRAAPIFYELNINTGSIRIINTSDIKAEETTTETTTESTTYAINTTTTQTTTQAPTYSNDNSSSNNNNITLNGASSWATTSIEDANSKNLLKNMSDVTSNYQGSINREQFCRLIMNCFDALGGTRPSGYSTTFTDTTNSEVIYANMLGIVNGKSDTIFSPNDLITRQELAIMSKNMIDLFEDIPLINTTANFTDSQNISSWALNQVIFAQQEGILKGDNLGQILPLNNLTCEEAIIVVLRIFDKFD